MYRHREVTWAGAVETTNKTEKPSPPPAAVREVYSVTAQYHSSCSSPETAGTSRLEGVLAITAVNQMH